MRPPCALQHPRRQRGIRDIAGWGGSALHPGGLVVALPWRPGSVRGGESVRPCSAAAPPPSLPGPPRAVQGRICLPSLWSPALAVGLGAVCLRVARTAGAPLGWRVPALPGGRGPEPAGPLRRHRGVISWTERVQVSQGNCRVRGRWENRPSLLRAAPGGGRLAPTETVTLLPAPRGPGSAGCVFCLQLALCVL